MTIRVPGTVSILVLAFLALVGGCGGDEQPEEESAGSSAVASSEVAQEYADELDVDLSSMTRSESGLYVGQIAEGEGEPAAAGDTVVVHYTGWLPDGTKFDSSRDRDEPFPVQIGAGRVIAGWDEGVVGMRPGGRRMLVIPPSMGYGTRGAGGAIPPNATLVFDVELLEVR